MRYGLAGHVADCRRDSVPPIARRTGGTLAG